MALSEKDKAAANRGACFGHWETSARECQKCMITTQCKTSTHRRNPVTALVETPVPEPIKPVEKVVPEIPLVVTEKIGPGCYRISPKPAEPVQMKIETKFLPATVHISMSIADFAFMHGLTLRIIERPPETKDIYGRFYAEFKELFYKTVVSVVGNGKTPHEAVESLCRNISQKEAVVRVQGMIRKIFKSDTEIVIPTLYVPENLVIPEPESVKEKTV